MNREILIKAEALCKSFSNGRKKMETRAVDRVSLTLYKGECYGLVGESGCGKSTLGRLLLQLIQKDGGKIFYNGKEISDMEKLRPKMQIVFQDPGGSLDPKMKVSDIVSEGLLIHNIGKNKEERLEIAKKQLLLVGLGEECLNRFPSSFSGGQQQRIAIARALSLNPEFLVCDEPVSSLDVSYQAQILNLLKELQRKRNMTYLFISHDLNVVYKLSDRIGVMYMGSLVEEGSAEEVCKKALHPYTKALLSAIPSLNISEEENESLMELGLAIPQKGCRFYPRCKFAKKLCQDAQPELKEVENEHKAACWLYR